MAEQHKLSNNKKDWSDLPPDIVNLIAKKISHLEDFVRFQATCKAWCSSALFSDFTLGLPWLLEFHQQHPNDLISAPTTRLTLYSMTSSETFIIPIKESRWFIGSSNGYLPLINKHTGAISLSNPLTNDEFDVPLIHDQRKQYSSLVIGTEPGHIRDRRTLIVDHGDHRRQNDRWAIYDPHYGRWSEQDGVCFYSCYCQGMFFYSDNFAGSETKVFDASSKDLLYTVLPHEDEMMDAFPPGQQFLYLWSFKSYITDSSGEILRVNWHYPKEILTNSKFDIYRLTFDKVAGGQHCWVKLSGIGDQILFLETANVISRAAYGFSIKVVPASGLKGGLIYFIDPDEGKPYMYDIVTGRTERIPCPFDRCTWFVPKLSS